MAGRNRPGGDSPARPSPPRRADLRGAARPSLGGSPMCATVRSPTIAGMKSTLPLLAATALALLAPAAAQAATISYEGDTLVYRADPGVRDSPMLGLSQDGTKLAVLQDGLKLPAG